MKHADTQLYTSPLQFEGDTQPRETGISPSGNVSKATVQHKPGSLEKPHSPKCIPADNPVSMQQDGTHLDGSAPMKKIAGSYPPHALFQQFPLISVNSRKLF